MRVLPQGFEELWQDPPGRSFFFFLWALFELQIQLEFLYQEEPMVGAEV